MVFCKPSEKVYHERGREFGRSVVHALREFLGTQKPWDISWDMGETESESSGENQSHSSEFWATLLMGKVQECECGVP